MFTTVETTDFLAKPTGNHVEMCRLLADQLRATGIVIIKDPRVSQDDNERFLTLMEDYFAQSNEDKKEDERPDLAYQVGVTPDNVEVPRCKTDENCVKFINTLPASEKPVPVIGADLKWRFFWRVGPRPEKTQFAELNAPAVIPRAFPHWGQTMDHWGSLMCSVVHTVCQMAALGFGLPVDAFTSLCNVGPHLLAPTGSDLSLHHNLNDIFAGFHYDLNFITIHGKSRFPGLYVWTREGKRVPVKVPDGCLLIQAGKQLEWLTGGDVQAGYHEVIVTDDTLKAVEAQKARNRPLWRISSTLFFHINSDATLKPLGRFSNPETLHNYPPMLAGHQVEDELKYIELKH